jgi:hypothetical protein
MADDPDSIVWLVKNFKLRELLALEPELDASVAHYNQLKSALGRIDEEEFYQMYKGMIRFASSKGRIYKASQPINIQYERFLDLYTDLKNR